MVLIIGSLLFGDAAQWFLVQETQCGERNSIFLLMNFLSRYLSSHPYRYHYSAIYRPIHSQNLFLESSISFYSESKAASFHPVPFEITFGKLKLIFLVQLEVDETRKYMFIIIMTDTLSVSCFLITEIMCKKTLNMAESFSPPYHLKKMRDSPMNILQFRKVNSQWRRWLWMTVIGSRKGRMHFFFSYILFPE